MYSSLTSANQTAKDLTSFWYFPKNVLCDLNYLGDLRKTQKFTYQCSMPANVFNEIVFLFLWAWFVVLVLFNLYSLLKWLGKFMFRRMIIKNMLLWPFKYNYHIDKFIDSFVYDYLSTEGFLVLMLIKANTQDWHCRSIVRVLWKFYIQRLRDDVDSPRLGGGEENEFNHFTGVSSTVKVPTRREYNYEMRDLQNSTPIRTTAASKIISLPEKECKNNYKLNEEFVILKRKEDMV